MTENWLRLYSEGSKFVVCFSHYTKVRQGNTKKKKRERKSVCVCVRAKAKATSALLQRMYCSATYTLKRIGSIVHELLYKYHGISNQFHFNKGKSDNIRLNQQQQKKKRRRNWKKWTIFLQKSIELRLKTRVHAHTTLYFFIGHSAFDHICIHE